MTNHQVYRLIYTLGALLLGFVATAAVLQKLPIDRLNLYAEQRSEKLALLQAMKGSANVAAFGSSHVHCGFDPRAFDQTFNAGAILGFPVKSINLGIQGGSQTEQRVMACAFLDALKRSQAKPAIILLEINAGANFGPNHLMHPRTINIYDWNTVQFANSFTDGVPLVRRLGRQSFAFAAGSLYASNVGVLSNFLFGRKLNQAIYAEDTKEDRRGLLLHQADHATSEKLDKLFATPVNPGIPQTVSLANGSRRLIEEIGDRVKALYGADSMPQFVYFVAPLASDRKKIQVYPESIETSFGLVPIINIARIDRFPQLYERPLWLDNSHLNEAGAKVFSELLARELLAWMRKEPEVANRTTHTSTLSQ